MSLELQLRDLAAAIGGDIGSLMEMLNARAVDLASLTTTQKSSLVAAINELDAAIEAIGNAPSGVQINDATTTLTTTWSSNEIAARIASAIAALVDGAPGALDTLNELAAALGDNANYSATITAALANRVRFDAAQTLTVAQQKTASQNIGVGDPETNFVAVYTTARDA